MIRALFPKSRLQTFAKTERTASQTAVLHNAKKENILRAYCNCMVVKGSTCNHIAAALFRDATAMKLGLINPASTDNA